MGTKRTSIVTLTLLLIIAVTTLIPQVCVTAQSYNDAVAYLNMVEQEVMTVAAQATQNFAATCGTSIPHQLIVPTYVYTNDIAAWLNTACWFYSTICVVSIFESHCIITYSALLYHLTYPKKSSYFLDKRNI